MSWRRFRARWSGAGPDTGHGRSGHLPVSVGILRRRRTAHPVVPGCVLDPLVHGRQLRFQARTIPSGHERRGQRERGRTRERCHLANVDLIGGAAGDWVMSSPTAVSNLGRPSESPVPLGEPSATWSTDPNVEAHGTLTLAAGITTTQVLRLGDGRTRLGGRWSGDDLRRGDVEAGNNVTIGAEPGEKLSLVTNSGTDAPSEFRTGENFRPFREPVRDQYDRGIRRQRRHSRIRSSDEDFGAALHVGRRALLQPESAHAALRSRHDESARLYLQPLRHPSRDVAGDLPVARSSFKAGEDFTLHGSLYGRNTDVFLGDRATVFGAVVSRTIAWGRRRICITTTPFPVNRCARVRAGSTRWSEAPGAR